LQKNTKKIRQDVAKGIHFVVIYRSKPVFEIRPLPSTTEFTEAFKTEGIYTQDFLNRMEEAENDIKKGKVKTYSPEDFLKSLS